MYKRVIALFPPPSVLEPIAELRRRFDPLAARMPPHLTLVFPFASDLSLHGLCAHMERATRGIGPFPIRLAGITGSEEQYLFLNVKRGNDTIIALHDRLYCGPLRDHLSLAHTFVPHLTVGRLPSREAFRSALATATALQVSIDALATALTAYRIAPDGSRVVEGEIPLI